MNKITLALKSRTFWTLIVLFVVNGVNAIHDSIPATNLQVVDAILGFLITYFHISPSQQYK